MFGTVPKTFKNLTVFWDGPWDMSPTNYNFYLYKEKNMRKKQTGMSEEEKRKRSEAIQRIVFPLASSAVASVAKVLVEHLITRGV